MPKPTLRPAARRAAPSDDDDENGPPRVLIVAHRLPVVQYRDGEVGEKMMGSFYAKSKQLVAARVKGLYTAMSSAEASQQFPMRWIGWPGLMDASPTEEVALRAELDSRDCVPVMLRRELCAPCFDGMCNDVLWPLMHCGEPGLGDVSLHGHEAQWRAYVEVNKAFAAEALRCYRPGDSVFVHDYHLMLVPALLRAAEPGMRVGWFCHVPFPPEPLWRRLPSRRQLLEAVLAADTIGFHTVQGAALAQSL